MVEKDNLYKNHFLLFIIIQIVGSKEPFSYVLIIYPDFIYVPTKEKASVLLCLEPL